MSDESSELPTESSGDRDGSRDDDAVERDIDRYRLLHRIGEGGMGDVWLAEQLEPIHRRVALKIIKHGMDSRRVVARFEAERQTLAIMDHPHIAKVFDAGRTPAGRPYFVMEYVDGDPITSHCDRHRLDLPERLALFLQACAGVQHAHQKAVIHRDLKPSNVLVSLVDGAPVVKIIDFGIAKAVEQPLAERSIFTELGTLVGTPEYMSPEQAELGAIDIDTRTDVYSLGVVLYELLTGVLPFDSRELREAGYDELRRRIREVEPSKPSTRVAALGDRSTEPALSRRSEPRTLSRQLRGDLDWITMRALEKDRARRYESPAALADDVRRHLRREPVVASPPSATYRAGRFVRRHGFGVATAVAASIVLVAVSVATTFQARIIARERDAAESGRVAAEAAAVFLSTLFDAANPVLPGGGARSIDEVLDAARVRVLRAGSGAGGAELRARIADRLGSALHQRGRLGDAREVLAGGLSRAREDLGADHRVTLRIANQLAYLYTTSGSCDDAEWLHLDVLARQRRALGPEDPETVWSLNNLAYAYRSQGRFGDAQPLTREVVELRTKVLGGDHRDTLRARFHLAHVRYRLGRIGEAEKEAREAVGRARGVLGAGDPDTLDGEGVHAMMLAELGRVSEADASATRVHEASTAHLGPEHEATLRSASRLARVRTMRGEYVSAEAILRRALEAVPPSSEDTGRIEPLLSALADLHAVNGASQRTVGDLERYLELVRERAARCRTDASAANGHAWLLLTARPAELRDPATALREARRANEIVRGTDPNFLDTLALAEAENGDRDAAIRTARSALALLPDDTSTLRVAIEDRLRAWTSTPK